MIRKVPLKKNDFLTETGQAFTVNITFNVSQNVAIRHLQEKEKKNVEIRTPNSRKLESSGGDERIKHPVNKRDVYNIMPKI